MTDDLERLADEMTAWAHSLLRIVLWLGVWVLVVLALLFSGNAAAQTTQTCPAKPACDPLTQKDRTKCGAELKGTTATGQWRAWWYVGEVTPTATRWCSFKWAMLDKYAPTNPRATLAIVDAIKDANDKPQAIMDALTQNSVKPPAGSQDEYEFRMLLHAGCQGLLANPPAAWISGQEPKPCVAPTPPPPPPVLSPYIVTSSPAYAVVNGKRSVTPTGSAVPGQPCDCAALQIIEFNVVRYCASPSITGIAGPAVAACRPRPQ